MKKLLSLLTLSAAAIMMLTACNPENNENGKTAKLTLSAVPLTVKIGAEGTFTVTSDIEAPENIAVTVTSSDEKTLKIADDSKSVAILKGGTTVTGKFTGLSVGKADISIESSNAEISAASVNITVEGQGEPENPENPDIIAIDLNYTSNPAPVDTGSDWCSFKFPSPDADDGVWQVGGLWVTNRVNSNDPGSEFITTIDNYGMTCVGKMDSGTGKIHLSLIEKDVDISTLDFIENSYYNKETSPWYWPVVYAENYKSLAGKSGYIVMNFIYSNSDKGITKDIYPAWIKVSVADNGAVTVEDMAICYGYETFRTGQKK